MRFELPGQFRGPECEALLPVCRRIKTELQPSFDALGTQDLLAISPILRVGGSLGTFGEDSIEQVQIRLKEAQCDVVIAARDWTKMSSDDLYDLIRRRVVAASVTMLEAAGVVEMPAFLDR